ncbi:cullin-2-like [Hydractinia symbiolongicarpus]|uniref:cullin-2-like n=1 Tax=Hydractinia symbiolongicarpus TaxID=13093 RepID=UPI00254CE354|nr:cullin-2-like [Hydractinia symbiolongicarpus]
MSLRPVKVDFENTWQKIKGTLQAVLTWSKVSRPEWNERFSDVYSICVANGDGLDERLYKATKTFFEEHTKDIYTKINFYSKNLLKDYYDHWTHYKTGTIYINLLYRYLNDHYAFQKKHDYVEHIQISVAENDVMEIGQLALETWKAEVIEPLQDMLISALLSEIERDRKGERPPERIVHGVISSFIDVQEYERKGNPLKLYQTAFEEPLLTETSDFYASEANQFLETCNCSQYMQKVDTRLAEENLRVRRFLHLTTFDKLIKVAQTRLVQDHQGLLTAECKQMVKDRQTTDLLRMYKLLKPIPRGFQEMLQEFEEYIAETGLSRVKSMHGENETGQFVNVLLQLHKEYTELIEKTFNNDQAFFGSRDKACTKIVNHRFDPKRPCRAPELLAKYCDTLLKKSTKNLPDGEIDDKLNNVITIFKYLDDKDVFQKFYSKLLAKRLIHGLSASMDSEEGMITKLKLACGYEYTNKVHRMFTDVAISKDLNSKFSKFLDTSNAQLGINFSLLVLQSGAWPLGQTAIPKIAFPQELCKSVQMFETFYNNMFNGRKLSWLQHLSTAEIKLTYLKKPYIVTCTTYQMVVLLLFNENCKLSYNDMSNQCQLEEKELRRTLQSVVDVKLLQNETPDVEDLSKCSFLLNKNFANKRTKFKITAAVQKETPQEVEQTHTSVDEDRKMYTQAAIVRIMKARKILKHNILIQEVIDQSRTKFSPTTQLVKKCIEALIEKNYLERVKGARDEYSYVA